MQMYHWPRATCLKNYGDGDILVVAASVDEARDKAIAAYDAYLREERSWIFMIDGAVDPDEVEQYNLKWRELRDDIAVEPDVRDVVFIRGSE